MPQPNSTFLEEARDAARGTWALVLGRHNAAQYFDFSLRGLVGSFISLVLSVGITVFGPQMLGVPSPQGVAGSMALLSGLLLAMQIGAAYIVLQLMGRVDGFLPYLVADNWVNAYVSLLGAISVILMGGSEAMLLVMAVLAIVVEVNIARRIVTLAPMQIAIFIIAQISANFIGLLILGGLILQAAGPLPPV